MIKFVIKSLIVSFALGVYYHEADPVNAAFAIYYLIPLFIATDKVYVALQDLLAVYYPVAVAPTKAQLLYENLMPALGYDFLGNFSDAQWEQLV